MYRIDHTVTRLNKEEIKIIEKLTFLTDVNARVNEYITLVELTPQQLEKSKLTNNFGMDPRPTMELQLKGFNLKSN